VPAFAGFSCPGQWLAEHSLLPYLTDTPKPRTHRASVLAASSLTCCVLEGKKFKMAMELVQGTSRSRKDQKNYADSNSQPPTLTQEKELLWYWVP
jgi:hypothetical protein